MFGFGLIAIKKYNMCAVILFNGPDLILLFLSFSHENLKMKSKPLIKLQHVCGNFFFSPLLSFSMARTFLGSLNHRMNRPEWITT
jgi:hypothetical protein